MFSKKMIMIVGAIILIAVNIIILSVNSQDRTPSTRIGQVALFFVSPFQEFASNGIHFAQNIWRNYFDLVGVSRENDSLIKALKIANEKNNSLKELELSHARLQSLLEFKPDLKRQVTVAAVVGKDPSPWLKSVVIDKGTDEGVQRGMPVVTPDGIAGLVTDASSSYAKVLLITDQNSAVDALTQSTRSRGIVKGESSDKLRLDYVLRRHDITEGDIIISSGLDGVFPKGLRVGYVHEVIKPNSGIFQKVFVIPYVDFEKLEEVLVIIDSLEPVKFSKP
ncbi:MAG: rod shape-determining protein MreC [Deltaproteobacteria bacterium]|nr:MAG: rod shape-determining protein MreC [Deltaproteobacteria bacterium]RLC12953.1 MAG: rod shape-determining protein MreC [Deltaproteobacteria bacterium]HHE73744.1 rod shape-determining protein MreC [Desulfobacteraceae bacterium]